MCVFQYIYLYRIMLVYWFSLYNRYRKQAIVKMYLLLSSQNDYRSITIT